MGMFDSLYDASGNEYQTKALDRVLNRYEVGDIIELDAVDGFRDVIDYQMKVLGTAGMECATVTNKRLSAVPAKRDYSLPLLDYFGGWLS
jgi:hypothetical protein